METIGCSSFYGTLKIVGIVISIGGTMLLIFLSPMGSSTEMSYHRVGNKNWIQGPVLLFLSAVVWSLWLILQPELLKQYPSKLRLATLQSLLGSMQATVVAAALQRNIHSWRIGWNIQLASLAYAGVLVTGLSYGLQILCIEKKGPFYAAMFYPVQLLLTAIISAFIWTERLHYGSICGGIMIVGGLYCVLWGRSKESNQQTSRREPPGEDSLDVETR
ncbi:hypothetical protein CJ030_MR4G007966 [Morella rubra]|uniref:WAT1-related protein n=1 Tax=Morella rubra TaxID=262757 RepID=A0A6A1VUI8_9ROSI|nr:hypothetical protein CJ030_MR4G007966 [Morella rubra]